MSALTLPLDNRESNNYIHALEEQMNVKFRRATDKSVFFTSRKDALDDDAAIVEYNGQYKLVGNTFAGYLSVSDPLDTQLELRKYQIWVDDTGTFLVTGTGVISLGGYYLIPSGTSVTVSQNGSLSVPDENTFVAGSDPQVMWILEDEGLVYLFPYSGKAWYGAITLSAKDSGNGDQIYLFLIKGDGSYHTQTLPQAVNPNFVFFTHIGLGGITGEIYFTGKELEYVPDGFPTDEYVAPEFTYVPD